jgi:hypothetical protein
MAHDDAGRVSALRLLLCLTPRPPTLHPTLLPPFPFEIEIGASYHHYHHHPFDILLIHPYRTCEPAPVLLASIPLLRLLPPYDTMIPE